MWQNQCSAPQKKCKQDRFVDNVLRNNSCDTFQLHGNTQQKQLPKNKNLLQCVNKSNTKQTDFSYDKFVMNPNENQQQTNQNQQAKNDANVNSTQICDITNAQNMSKISNIDDVQQSFYTMDDIDKIEDVFKHSQKIEQAICLETQHVQIQESMLMPQQSIDFQTLENCLNK